MSASDRAQDAGRQANDSDWIDWVARVGLVAYGVVYLMIGWLSIQLAFGEREGDPSSSGAMQELAGQPFGGVLIWVISIGMFLLVLWQGLEALEDRFHIEAVTSPSGVTHLSLSRRSPAA